MNDFEALRESLERLAKTSEQAAERCAVALKETNAAIAALAEANRELAAANAIIKDGEAS